MEGYLAVLGIMLFIAIFLVAPTLWHDFKKRRQEHK